MTKLVDLIYRIGIRPKRGSYFYSTVHAFLYAKGVKYVRSTFRKRLGK